MERRKRCAKSCFGRARLPVTFLKTYVVQAHCGRRRRMNKRGRPGRRTASGAAQRKIEGKRGTRGLSRVTETHAWFRVSSRQTEPSGARSLRGPRWWESYGFLQVRKRKRAAERNEAGERERGRDGGVSLGARVRTCTWVYAWKRTLPREVIHCSAETNAHGRGRGRAFERAWRKNDRAIARRRPTPEERKMRGYLWHARLARLARRASYVARVSLGRRVIWPIPAVRLPESEREREREREKCKGRERGKGMQARIHESSDL